MVSLSVYSSLISNEHQMTAGPVGDASNRNNTIGVSQHWSLGEKIVDEASYIFDIFFVSCIKTYTSSDIKIHAVIYQ